MKRPAIVSLELEDMPDSHSATAQYILSLENALTQARGVDALVGPELDCLRDAIERLRAARCAYNDWFDALTPAERATDRRTECALRTALGGAEAHALRAADAFIRSI